MISAKTKPIDRRSNVGKKNGPTFNAATDDRSVRWILTTRHPMQMVSRYCISEFSLNIRDGNDAGGLAAVDVPQPFYTGPSG